MTRPPKFPSDPRDGEPYYIDKDCPDCGTNLILVDEFRDEEVEFHDEWICPECEDGVYVDWPEEVWEAFTSELERTRQDEDYIVLDELEDDNDN